MGDAPNYFDLPMEEVRRMREAADKGLIVDPARNARRIASLQERWDAAVKRGISIDADGKFVMKVPRERLTNGGETVGRLPGRIGSRSIDRAKGFGRWRV